VATTDSPGALNPGLGEDAGELAARTRQIVGPRDPRGLVTASTASANDSAVRVSNNVARRIDACALGTGPPTRGA
jgi:hypothetical protein